MQKYIKVSTPELLWHGGGNDNGKPDPVYSVDLHPTNILATAGIDAGFPPKGSVRVITVTANVLMLDRTCLSCGRSIHY